MQDRSEPTPRTCPCCGGEVWRWKDDAFCCGWNGCKRTFSVEQYEALPFRNVQIRDRKKPAHCTGACDRTDGVTNWGSAV